jgi:hypothetical protein
MGWSNNVDCNGDKCSPYSSKQVRILPTGGGSNAILCKSCYINEIEFRKYRINQGVDYELPKWEDLKVYE